MEACVTLGMLTDDQAQAPRGGRARRVQPQPRHLARVLQARSSRRAPTTTACARSRTCARPASPSAPAASSAWARPSTTAARCCATLAQPRAAAGERADQRARAASRARRSRRMPPVDPLELVRMIATARILMPQRAVRLSAGRTELLARGAAALHASRARTRSSTARSCSPRRTPDTDADVDLIRDAGLSAEAPAPVSSA